MFRRLLASALLLASLTACKQDAPAPTADTAEPPAAAPTAPAAAPATAEPAAPTDADPQAATPAPAPADAVAPTVDPNAPEPRLGTDYDVIELPQPTWGSNDGRIEVAEVFSYRCVHCAEFQPQVNAWTKPSAGGRALGVRARGLRRHLGHLRPRLLRGRRAGRAPSAPTTRCSTPCSSSRSIKSGSAGGDRRPSTRSWASTRQVPGRDEELRRHRQAQPRQAVRQARRRHRHADHHHQRQVPGERDHGPRLQGHAADGELPAREGTRRSAATTARQARPRAARHPQP